MTVEDLRKDILRLQVLIIQLQDLAVSQGERISELEQDIRPEPLPPKDSETLRSIAANNLYKVVSGKG